MYAKFAKVEFDFRERESKRTRLSFLLKSLFSLLLFASLFFVFDTPVHATTYYVGLTGSDANTAIQAQNSSTPWATIEYAIENGVLHFGDTLILEAGTYTSTNIWKTGTNNNIRSSFNITTGSGALTIMAQAGQTVTIDVPSTTVGGLFNLQGNFIIQNINFTNSTAAAVYLFLINDQNQSATNLTFNNCTFDYNNAAKYLLDIDTGITNYDAHLTVNSAKVKNVNSSWSFVRSAIDPTNKTKIAYISINSSLFRNTGSVTQTFAGTSNGPTNLTFINNTVANLNTAKAFNGIDNTSTVKIENNIFRADSTFTWPIYIYNDIPGSNWTVKNNDFYRAITTDPSSELEQIVTAWGDAYPLDSSNFYADPLFNNEGGDDYSLGSSSYANGRGIAADLPANDVNGNSWSGAHMGAYSNTSTTPAFPTLQTATVAFVGDSIAQGAGNQLVTDGGYTVVGNGVSGAAIGGTTLMSLPYLIDRAATTWKPKTIFIISGNNSFTGSGNSPAFITYTQAANIVQVAMAKAKYWGMTPIFLGMGGMKGADPSTAPIAFNNAAQAICTTNNYVCGSWLNYMIAINPSSWNLATTSGGYYQAGGVNVNIHPATAGYELILDEVKNLYNKVGVIGSNNIDIGAGARIYSDGSFININSSTGTTANVSVTPQSGSFITNKYTLWMDILFTNWDHDKKIWTESSSSIGNSSVPHTIGGLSPGATYQLIVDGATQSSYVANSSGQVTFTYTGGYSSHTFELDSVITAAGTSFCNQNSPILAPWIYKAISNDNGSITIKFTNWDNLVDHFILEYGLSPNNYQYAVGDIGGNSANSYTVSSLSPGKTYYFRVRGANGCAVGPWSNELSIKSKFGINDVNISNEKLDLGNHQAQNMRSDLINLGPDTEDKNVQQANNFIFYVRNVLSLIISFLSNLISGLLRK